MYERAFGKLLVDSNAEETEEKEQQQSYVMAPDLANSGSGSKVSTNPANSTAAGNTIGKGGSALGEGEKSDDAKREREVAIVPCRHQQARRHRKRRPIPKKFSFNKVAVLALMIYQMILPVVEKAGTGLRLIGHRREKLVLSAVKPKLTKQESLVELIFWQGGNVDFHPHRGVTPRNISSMNHSTLKTERWSR